MFHNISNPKWFGNWSRLEDDYLGNGGTDIADNFTFSKREKTGGLFGSIISLATAFPACDQEAGESRSLTDGELSRVEGYFTVISEPGSGEKAVDAIRHGMEPCGYDISVETHDMASGKDALLADAPQRDAPAKDTQNIG